MQRRPRWTVRRGRRLLRGSAQRGIDQPEQAGCFLGQFAGQVAEVIWSGDRSHSEDGRTVHPGLQPARSAQVGLKIFQFLQQHDDVFAARCEICGACSTMCSQPLELSEQGQDSGRTSRCASPPAARATAAARPARPGIRAQARRLSADKFGRALSPSARLSLYRSCFSRTRCAPRSKGRSSQLRPRLSTTCTSRRNSGVRSCSGTVRRQSPYSTV